MRSRFGLLVVGIVGAGQVVAWAAEPPLAVSPGNATGALIADTCPTFSWSTVPDAMNYELVIYRVGEDAKEAREVLRRSFAGSVDSWTPALESCLERGGQYAWSVRAVGLEEPSAWSAPSLFEVTSGPSEAELEAAVEVVRHYLAHEGPRPDLLGSESKRGQETAARGPRLAPAVSAVGASTARLTVEGEVRTLDPGGEPRLWGKGRPGVTVYERAVVGGYCSNASFIKLSLSSAMVDWGSVADGCPAGTWVCRLSDMVPCNTARPDSAIDWQHCDSTYFDEPENAHIGWIADQYSFSTQYGNYFRENGVSGGVYPCSGLPVWCCWE